MNIAIGTFMLLLGICLAIAGYEYAAAFFLGVACALPLYDRGNA